MLTTRIVAIVCDIDEGVAKAQLQENTVKATLHDADRPLRRRLVSPAIAVACFAAAFPLGVYFQCVQLFLRVALAGALIATLAAFSCLALHLARLRFVVGRGSFAFAGPDCSTTRCARKT